MSSPLGPLKLVSQHFPGTKIQGVSLSLSITEHYNKPKVKKVHLIVAEPIIRFLHKTYF